MVYSEFSAAGHQTGILHLIHGLNFGGIENWLLAALRHMPRDEFAMDVCYKARWEGDLAPQAREAGARLQPCPLGPAVLTFVQRLKNILRRGRYSLLHVHTGAHSGPAVYAANAVGIPAVVTFHSTQQAAQTTFTRLPGVRAARAIYARRSTRYALLHSAVATGVSSSVVEAMTKVAGLPQNRCEVFQLGCPRPVRPSAEQLAEYRKELRLAPESRVIVHVGSMRACKNHTGMIQVVQRIVSAAPDVVLLLVGDGPLRPKIQEKIARHGLDRHVRLLGSRRDATAIMQLGELFLFPSLYEGLSVAMMEACAAGLPIVASNIPGNREATGGGAAARLHDAADVDGMAASAIELLHNAEERRILAGHARAVYERTFSMEASIERLMTLYHRVLRRGEHAQPVGRIAS